MIETTYIRLEQAAAMLETDADTLLIAAAEGRMAAYWLLNSRLSAEHGQYEEMEEGPPCWIPDDYSFRHFMFIPLGSVLAASLLKQNEIKEEPYQLSNPDDNGRFWVVSGYSNFKPDVEMHSLTRHDVFFERAEIQKIKAAHAAPPPGTIKDTAPQRPAHRDNSLMVTIAALMASWPGGPGAIPSGKQLDEAAQAVGMKGSDDTIRKVLKAVHEAAPTLPPPK